jgi:ABC-type transport system involved in multi-copper enzyme maturation permease subunit
LLPQEVGSVWVLTPFKMLESSRGVVMALATLGMIGCLTAASLLCIILVRPVRDVQGLAHKAFKLLVVACVVFGVGFLIGSIRDIAELENVSGAVVLAFFLMLIKMLCWVVGLLLLLPVGLTDLLVNLTPAGPAACAEPGDTPVDAPSTG